MSENRQHRHKQQSSLHYTILGLETSMLIYVLVKSGKHTQAHFV